MSDPGAACLAAIFHHRLLRTDQVAELVMPEVTERRCLQVLVTLDQQRLIARTRPSSRHRWVWWATAKGQRACAGPEAERRQHRMTAERAAGPVQAHTLRLNDTGLAFLRAARQRADSGVWWSHERAFNLVRGKPVIADAVLDYLVHDGDALVSLIRFLEVDRGTTSARALVDKIAAYARLATVPASWRDQLRVRTLPPVLVVGADVDADAWQRRVDWVAGMCGRDRDVGMVGDGLTVLFGFLPEIVERSPFGAVWTPLAEPNMRLPVFAPQTASSLE